EALLDKEAVFQGDELEKMEQDIRDGCAFLSRLIEQRKLADPACQAWAIRLESRMCEPAVQQGAARRELQTVFSIIEPGKSTSRSGHVLDPELLPSNDQPEQKAWLCQQGRRLVVTRHVPTQVPQQNTSMLAALSYRRPTMKLVMDDGSSCLVELPDTLTTMVQPVTDHERVPLQKLHSIKTDLTELSLQVTEKPKWASSIGRDWFGLYAELSISNQKGEKVAQGFRWIPAGDFMMGSPDDEAERFNCEDYHKVILTNGYWLADTVVTQAMWKVITGHNPARFKNNELNPAENVNWNDAQEFIIELNRRVQETGTVEEVMLFRLPTEAEWEHACRAGAKAPFSFGRNITSEQVNYNPHEDGKKGVYRGRTIPVKSLPPNPWGLYEMHGNVLEWCEDSWQEYLGEQVITNPYYVSSSSRVVRGSSWIHFCRSVRSACRSHYLPIYRFDVAGFRLAFGHKLKPNGSAEGEGPYTFTDKECTE
ncbi:MAG: formylglycine-generating enzyme family protein, partial [Candidatus Electrothrix sp. ATG2]|nr:formylglycine-generating enzyme family protein [Candidatus Electrothrix sp. ATG2]